MVKNLFATTAIIIGLAGFSPVSAQKVKQLNASSKTEVKFLEDISVEIAVSSSVEKTAKVTEPELQYFAKKNHTSKSDIENASLLQLKYAILLDTEVEEIQINSLYEGIDEWYGTKYRYGGTTKDGIDCSAFVQTLFSSAYHLTLPRTAREQYDATARISRTELKEGDLVFFNTTGGISHVGIYLKNNKFVHAATSGGVMISDLFDNYWSKRFVGVGRFEKEQQPAAPLESISKL